MQHRTMPQHMYVYLYCVQQMVIIYKQVHTTTYLMIKFAYVIRGGLGQVEDLVLVGVFGVEEVTDGIYVVGMVDVVIRK